MNKKLVTRVSIVAILLTVNVVAQEKTDKAVSDTAKVKGAVPKLGGTTNVMLNASADNGPRAVNIGLPASVGGTTILENGLPVVYDFTGQLPVQAWRNDAGISKIDVLDVANTALLASDVGVSVSSWANRGTDKFKGSLTMTTNSYGLMRGTVGLSGPMKNNFYYSMSAFVNMDPGTYRTNISTFIDKTQIYRGLINKKYANGQIGIQYKYVYNEYFNPKQTPYIYHKNGKVSQIPGFRIGRDAYFEQSGKLNVIDPLTGEAKVWDAMKDMASTSHIIDVLGDHKFGNGMVLDYTLRYHYAKAGLYNYYLTSIFDVANPTAPKVGDRGYFYANNPEAPYKGLVQNGLMIATPSTVKNTVMGRIELSKKTAKHHWMLGFHNWYYNVDKANTATYAFQFEVKPNPNALITKVFDGSNWVTDTKKGTTDQYGNRNYNGAMQYYDGVDNKMALVGTEKWTISDKVTLNLGGRFEWQKIDGNWYSAEDRLKGGTNWVSGKTTDINEDWFNTSLTASTVYKAFKNAGLLADIVYIQQAGKLSMYAGADDPNIDKSEIPGLGAGVYFNHPWIRVVSKVTKIKRTNFKNNSTFNKEVSPGVVETDKQTISYDVNTVGWTTDLMFTPTFLKGFSFHMLLTLQNPKYENYAFTVFGDRYDNSGNVARSVSKTIIELDPSYSWDKFRIWASGRYFSKEYANYPNTLIFAGRWETFAGLDFKYNKNIDFGVSVVNLFNQSGAQGSISGTNTTTAEQAKALYDKPLAGTYIRPFTIEFKTRIKF